MFKETRVPSKIGAIPSETLEVDLENFATASRWCGQQNLSTVELVDYIYDGRARHGWMHKVYYTLVDVNPLTPLFWIGCTTFSYTVEQPLARF